MPRTVTEDVDGKKGKKERKEKREALWEVGFDHSLGGKKNAGMKKKRGENGSGNWRRGFYSSRDSSAGKASTSGSEGNRTDCCICCQRRRGVKKEPVICDRAGEDE